MNGERLDPLVVAVGDAELNLKAPYRHRVGGRVRRIYRWVTHERAVHGVSWQGRDIRVTGGPAIPDPAQPDHTLGVVTNIR